MIKQKTPEKKLKTKKANLKRANGLAAYQKTCNQEVFRWATKRGSMKQHNVMRMPWWSGPKARHVLGLTKQQGFCTRLANPR